jgi:hypothetical protein
MNLMGVVREKRHAPKWRPGQQAILYRIYARDKGGQNLNTGSGVLTVDAWGWACCARFRNRRRQWWITLTILTLRISAGTQPNN